MGSPAAIAGLLALGALLGAPQAPAADGRDGRAAALARRASAEPGSALEEIVRGLRRLREADPPPAEEIAAGLVREAAQNLDALLDLLLERRVPALGEAPPQTLSEAQHGLVLALLSAQPKAPVLEAARRVITRSDSPRRHLVALDAVGTVGAHGEMAGAIHHAEEALRTARERDVEEVLQRALASMLRRSRHTHEWLNVNWRRLRPELLTAALFAVGEARDPRGLELLADVIRWSEEFAPLAIATVRLLGASASEDLNVELRELLCRFLDPGDPGVCRAATLALAAIGPEDSYPLLIDLLECEDRGVRENALWSLRRASGLTLPGNPAQWTRWYESEARWFDERFDAALAAIDDPDPVAAVAAVRELSARRLHLDWTTEGLIRALYHPSPAVRVLSCRSLAVLGRPEALPALELALRDRDDSVSAAALSALERLGRGSS